MERKKFYPRPGLEHGPLVLSQGSSTFRVRGPIYIIHVILRVAVIADYRIITNILNIITGAGAARQIT